MTIIEQIRNGTAEPKFKAKANATLRTKNRFREHTLLPALNKHGEAVVRSRMFKGVTKGWEDCVYMESLERTVETRIGWASEPLWFGWIPVRELEAI